MATYATKFPHPSADGFKLWVQMGYTGSYEMYAKSTKENAGSVILIHGDLGPHCSDCAAPSDNLCDYPVGDGKTCDRKMCDEHSHGIANDVHYCRDHFIMWREYLASQRGYDVLDNVTPLGVVRSDSGGDPTGENSRSEVECEASQSGGETASPNA